MASLPPSALLDMKVDSFISDVIATLSESAYQGLDPNKIWIQWKKNYADAGISDADRNLDAAFLAGWIIQRTLKPERADVKGKTKEGAYTRLQQCLARGKIVPASPESKANFSVITLARWAICVPWAYSGVIASSPPNTVTIRGEAPKGMWIFLAHNHAASMIPRETVFLFGLYLDYVQSYSRLLPNYSSQGTDYYTKIAWKSTYIPDAHRMSLCVTFMKSELRVYGARYRSDKVHCAYLIRSFPDEEFWKTECVHLGLEAKADEGARVEAGVSMGMPTVGPIVSSLWVQLGRPALAVAGAAARATAPGVAPPRR